MILPRLKHTPLAFFIATYITVLPQLLTPHHLRVLLPRVLHDEVAVANTIASNKLTWLFLFLNLLMLLLIVTLQFQQIVLFLHIAGKVQTVYF